MQTEQDEPIEFVRPKKSAAEIGVSLSTWWDMVAKGVLPRPVKIGTGRAVGQIRSELETAKRNLIAKRDPGQEA